MDVVDLFMLLNHPDSADEKAKITKAYNQQRKSAKNRCIEWQLTLVQWVRIWIDSGKYEQRGRKSGQYVMSRHGDVGPYSVENVFICEAAQNHVDAHLFKTWVKRPKKISAVV